MITMQLQIRDMWLPNFQPIARHAILQLPGNHRRLITLPAPHFQSPGLISEYPALVAIRRAMPEFPPTVLVAMQLSTMQQLIRHMRQQSSRQHV